MIKKYQLMFPTIFIMLALIFWAACSAIPQYSNFTYPERGISVDYPKGWSIDSETPHETTSESGYSVMTIFKKPSSSLEITVIYDTTLSYQDWFGIFNSPLAADKLEIKDAREGAAIYSTFTQMGSSESASEFTRIYIVAEDTGVVIMFCSYDDNSVTSEERDLMRMYALRMINSFKIDNTEIE